MSQIAPEILDKFSKNIIKSVITGISKNINEFSDEISKKIFENVSVEITNSYSKITENILPKLSEISSKMDTKNSPKWMSMVVIAVSVIIVLLIFFTQCEFSNIRLKPKDASLILVILAFLAYINGFEKVFIGLLISFIIIYFTPNEKISKFFSGIFQKNSNEKERRFPKKVRRLEEENSINSEEVYSENEITLDTDIDEREEENVSMEIKKM